MSVVTPLDSLKSSVVAIPEVSAWPALVSVVERLVVSDLSIWDYPIHVCEATGGSRESALPAAVSLLCLCTSINIVDDILDGDEDGPLDEFGAGRTANMALALQAAATRVLLDSSLPEAQRTESLRWATSAGLATARGQDLDAGPCRDESDYWRIVEAKSTPLVAAATAMGAIASGSAGAVIAPMAEIGTLLGKIIQVNDDLADAMAYPAKADWRRPRHNLAMLYALTADHPSRERFSLLLEGIEDRDKLVEAQLILTKDGAVGFCVYQLVDLYRQVHKVFRSLSLPAPAALEELLRRHIVPAEALLEEAGLDSPSTLWES